MRTIPAAGAALLALAAAGAPAASQAQETPSAAALPAPGPGVVAPEAQRDEAFEEAAETADVGFPRVVWGVAADLEDDWTFSSTDKAAELNTLYPTIEAEVAVEFSEGNGLYTTFVLEPVRDPDGDSYFEDIGLYVEEIYVAGTAAGGWQGLIGKYDAAFGFAWDLAPGLYGTDFAEDYELSERLGLAASIPFTAFGEAQRVTFSGFTADSSALSDSLITRRGNVARADGGASNTNSPSFAAALDGDLSSELTYNVGLRWLQAGFGDAADEYGAVAGVVYAPEFAGGDVELLGEAAWFKNYDATDDDALYLTAGAAWGIDRWVVSGVYSMRDFEGAETDHLATASVGYQILDNLSAGVGYRFGREGGETSHTVGLLLSASFGGSFGIPTN